MIENFTFKDKYDINDLLEIMKILRSPGGCPWDAEQSHKSIRNDFIEEVYEVADAIDNNDADNLREELGDVLLQVVFHSQISKENGEFSFDDVADEICRKLINRHPHVFGDIKVASSDEVLDNWDKIKGKEKSRVTAADSMRAVPRAYGALMRAQKIQKRAAKVGFDWDDIFGAYEKIPEELAEVKEAVQSGDKDKILDEMGDLFFAAVNVARFAGVDSEEALQHSTDKFVRRFSKVEELATDRGIDMKSASIEELDKLWDEIKRSEK